MSDTEDLRTEERDVAPPAEREVRRHGAFRRLDRGETQLDVVGRKRIWFTISILIIVGVGLETVKQIDSQLQQRHYEGLLK